MLACTYNTQRDIEPTNVETRSFVAYRLTTLVRLNSRKLSRTTAHS